MHRELDLVGRSTRGSRGHLEGFVHSLSRSIVLARDDECRQQYLFQRDRDNNHLVSSTFDYILNRTSNSHFIPPINDQRRLQGEFIASYIMHIFDIMLATDSIYFVFEK